MIIFTKGNWLDFHKPIRMTEDQFSEFKSFLEEEFGSCEVKHVKEKVPVREGIEVSRKNWENWEMVELFSGKDVATLEKELDRNSMSIEMMGQKIIYQVIKWAKKRGRAIPPTQKDIEDFLGERE